MGISTEYKEMAPLISNDSIFREFRNSASTEEVLCLLQRGGDTDSR